MRFNYARGEWVGTRNQGGLLGLLETEIRESGGLDLNISRD